MLGMLEVQERQAAQSSAALVKEKRAEIAAVNARLQRLLDSFLDGIVERESYVAEKAKLMSRKRTLEEQNTALSKGRLTWLEPFRNWILEARTLGKIAKQGPLTEKRALARKIFGSNLVLDCRKACGRAIKPWALIGDNELSSQMVARPGIEPGTQGFSVLCSTN